MNKIRRVCIHARDIADITGYTIRRSRLILSDAKAFYKKSEVQFLTSAELAAYLSIPIETIEKFLE